MDNSKLTKIKLTSKRAHYSAKMRKITAFCKEDFARAPNLRYIPHAFAKNEGTAVESWNIPKANNSTPQACFFVCKIHTPQPQENAQNASVFSMMACSGQSLWLAAFPLVRSFPPHYTLSPSRGKRSDSPITKGRYPMLYKFLCVNRTPNTAYSETIVTVQATNADEARWALPSIYRLLLANPIACVPMPSTETGAKADYTAKAKQWGKSAKDLPDHAQFAENCPNATACNTPSRTNAHVSERKTLKASNFGGSIQGTTTKNGHRTRKICGFFVPQNHPQANERNTQAQNLTMGGSEDERLQADFVARSIRRTKADFIRTNNASRFFAVVEALPHPHKGNGNLFTHLLNKEKTPMTPITIKPLSAGIGEHRPNCAQNLTFSLSFQTTTTTQGGLYV